MSEQPLLIELPTVPAAPPRPNHRPRKTFTDAQEKHLQQTFLDLDAFGGVKIAWSRASERRLWSMFASLAAWMVAAPVSVVAGSERESAPVAKRHGMDLFIERFLAVRRWLDEVQVEIDEAKSQAELQAALTRLAARQRDIERRLTNVEVCLIMMELSLRAPLSREAAAEYMRAFAHIFGVDTYLRIHANGEHIQPLNIEACRLARWNCHTLTRRFPPLDDVEIAWIHDFNARCRAALAQPPTP